MIASRWNRISLIVAAGLAFIYLGWKMGSPRVGPPHVAADRSSHNWGRVKPGSNVSTSFVISNTGGERLQFGDPKASCGCTKPTLPVRVLDPGKSLKLEVGFSVPAEPGRVGHRVTIPTNDPDSPSLEIHLFADAWLGVRPVPQSIDAGRLGPGSKVERAIQLFSPDGKPFQIGDVSSDIPEVRVALDTSKTPLPVHRLRVAYHAGTSLGIIKGMVRVVTDLPDAPWVDIPVAGEVVGPVAAHPSYFQIDRDEIGQVVRRSLILRDQSGTRDLRKLDVTVSDPWEVVGHRSHAVSDGVTSLEVDLRFPRTGRAESGEMLLRWGTPEQGRFRVPLIIVGWTRPLPEAAPR